MTPDDRLAIHDLVASYCQAYDDHDDSALGAIFAPEATLILRTGAEQVVRGREQVLAWLARGWPGGPVCLHLTGNVRVVADGDGAQGFVDYVFAVRGADGLELRQAGRYLDRYERIDGQWFIGSRTITVLPPAP